MLMYPFIANAQVRTITSYEGTVVGELSETRTTQKLKLTCTSDANGIVTAITDYYVSGYSGRAIVIPGTGGDEPTNAFNITLKDEQGIDVLYAAGIDSSSAASAQLTATMLMNNILTVSVTGAGAANVVTLEVYFSKCKFN